MNAIRHIRKDLLDLSQADFAKIAGVTQGTVSRWESTDDPSEPDRAQLLRVREFAASRGIDWNDAWFFVLPSAELPAESAAA